MKDDYTEINPRFMITIYAIKILKFNTHDLVCLHTRLPSATPLMPFSQETIAEPETITVRTAKDYGYAWLQKSFGLLQNVITEDHRTKQIPLTQEEQ